MHAILAAAFLFCGWAGAQDKPAPQEKPQEKPPPQEPAPEPVSEATCPMTLRAVLRFGGWRMGGFESLTPLGSRKIETTLLFDAGADLQAECGGWTLTLSGDYASGKSVRLESGALLLGMSRTLAPDSLPLELQVSAGPVLGVLDVDMSGFGNFKNAVGVEARVSATSWLHERIGLSLWADYRHLTFKFDAPVVSGDKSAGGSTFALGAGFVMRF